MTLTCFDLVCGCRRMWESWSFPHVAASSRLASKGEGRHESTHYWQRRWGSSIWVRDLPPTNRCLLCAIARRFDSDVSGVHCSCGDQQDGRPDGEMVQGTIRRMRVQGQLYRVAHRGVFHMTCLLLPWLWSLRQLLPKCNLYG